VALGWGIVGIGFIADRGIAPSVQELGESELTAVVSRDQGRADAFAKKYGAKRAYTSYEEMLADPAVQIVAITSPNALHHDEAVAAARAGKHILCDKPLALSARDAEDVLKECQKTGVKLGINFHLRYHACFLEARRLIEAGDIGDVSLIDIEVSNGGSELKSWRADPQLAGRGVTFNIGVHAFDLLRYLLADEVSEVVTMTEVGREDKLERIAISLFRFSKGAIAHINANQALPFNQPGISIYGTKGRISGHWITRPFADGDMLVVTEGHEKLTNETTQDCYRRVIDDFNHAVLEDREPHANGLDGLRSTQLTDAIARSVRDGKVVQLSY
jgi:1,5-anhydro-D-fructose reductase (1,5-anhydro-D-mannitol-forming)